MIKIKHELKYKSQIIILRSLFYNSIGFVILNSIIIYCFDGMLETKLEFITLSDIIPFVVLLGVFCIPLMLIDLFIHSSFWFELKQWLSYIIFFILNSIVIFITYKQAFGGNSNILIVVDVMYIITSILF